MAHDYYNGTMFNYQGAILVVTYLLIVASYTITVSESLEIDSTLNDAHAERNAALFDDIQRFEKGATSNNNTATQLNLTNSIASTPKEPHTKNDPKLKSWTHTDSYEWTTTSDGTREETIDSNGRKQIKTKLINYVQAPPNAINKQLPIRPSPLASVEPIQQFNRATLSNRPPQFIALEAPVANAEGRINDQFKFIQSAPYTPLVATTSPTILNNASNNNNNNNNNNNGVNLAKQNLNYAPQQLAPNDMAPSFNKQPPVFVSSTLRRLPNQEPQRLTVTKQNIANNNNHNAITTYNFPNSDMRVHLGPDEVDNEDQPSALRAQLDDAIFDTMSSHLSNGVQPRRMDIMHSSKDPQNNNNYYLTANQPQRLQSDNDQIKLNLNNILRQMAKEEQQNRQPSATDFPLANRQPTNQQNNLRQQQYAQNGQASSLNQATLQSSQPINSPWTIQRRLYVISYPMNANTTVNDHSGNQTNQTVTQQSQQTVNSGQPQAVVQVFEQTQHFAGNPNTPTTRDKINNNNNRIYQYPNYGSHSTASGGAHQPIGLSEQANVPKIDNLFNLWNR